jgi:hypothetical protein
MDECDLRTKRVPENADGTPKSSMRSRGHVPYPRG